MKAKILWIEGKRADSPSFVPGLQQKGYQVEVVTTGNAAIERLPDVNPALAVINAVSLRTSGKTICRSLREKMINLPIIIITGPDQPAPSDACANVTLQLPFTQRKLINRISSLIPGSGDSMLRAGRLRLDLERRHVHCEGKDARLTPRLASILQILMQHAGEVVEREQLFKEVWKTKYTGDTRTLDVHMSWLRHAIEEDPRHPRFLKTIRGVGYRLDS